MKNITKILFLLVPISLFFTGCGPGFPIVTAKQNDLMNNVDRLMRDNEALKKRMSALEGGEGSGGGGLEDIKASVAESSSAIEEIRREFSFIRGSIEDGENQRAQLAEEIKSINESLGRLDARLTAREASGSMPVEGAPGGASELETLKSTVAANQEKLTALEASVGALTSGMEEKTKPAVRKVDPEELYFKGFRLMKDRELDRSAGVFRQFLEVYPKDKLADHARYWLGEIYYSKGDWEKAILEFDRVIKEYPKGDKVPAAILKEGFSFEKLGSPKEARVLLQRVIERYPDSPEAVKAKERLDGIKE